MQVEDAADGAGDTLAHAGACCAGAFPDRRSERDDLVGHGDRRMLGLAGERLGGHDRHEPVLCPRQRRLRRLERHDRVRALATGRDEEMVQMLHGGLRMERDNCVLQLFGAHDLDQVARREHERVADGEIAAPHAQAQVVRCGQPDVRSDARA